MVQTKPLADEVTPVVQRQPEEEEEEEEELIQPKRENRAPGPIPEDLDSKIQHLRGGGRPLDTGTRGLMERRFGFDFSEVRIHADNRAADAAGSLRARAFTMGNNIVFNSGQYTPGSQQGKKLLAHELTHVVQQRKVRTGKYGTTGSSTMKSKKAQPSAVSSPVIQRLISPVVCSPGRMLSVNADSLRARLMLVKARAKLLLYSVTFGKTPAAVRKAMKEHFGTTSPIFAAILADAASSLALVAHIRATTTAYICRSNGKWPCKSTTNAWVAWCLPGPIVLCDPNYFNRTDKLRSKTLIHEWGHKYWCKLDIGYKDTPEYPKNFLTASINADNFAHLVLDLNK